MINGITKDGDVTETGKGEKGQRIHAQNSWMVDIFMLMYFLFAYVTWNLNCLYANEGKPIDKLSARQKEEELVCSMEFEHMLEKPKDLLQTRC